METLWPARETFFWHTRPPFFSASKKWDRSRLRRCCQLQCSSTDGSAARTFLDRLFNKSRDRSDAFRSVANTGSAASEHSLHRQEVQALQLWQASPPPPVPTRPPCPSVRSTSLLLHIKNCSNFCVSPCSTFREFLFPSLAHTHKQTWGKQSRGRKWLRAYLLRFFPPLSALP